MHDYDPRRLFLFLNADGVFVAKVKVCFLSILDREILWLYVNLSPIPPILKSTNLSVEVLAVRSHCLLIIDSDPEELTPSLSGAVSPRIGGYVPGRCQAGSVEV